MCAERLSPWPLVEGWHGQQGQQPVEGHHPRTVHPCDEHRLAMPGDALEGGEAHEVAKSVHDAHGRQAAGLHQQEGGVPAKHRGVPKLEQHCTACLAEGVPLPGDQVVEVVQVRQPKGEGGEEDSGCGGHPLGSQEGHQAAAEYKLLRDGRHQQVPQGSWARGQLAAGRDAVAPVNEEAAQRAGKQDSGESQGDEGG